MEALTVYLSVMTFVSIIATMYVAMKFLRRRLAKYNSKLAMYFFLTLVLSTFQTVSIIYLTLLQ